MSSITLKRVSKIYSGGAHSGSEYNIGDRVVNDVELDIDDGEFVVIVGPSGSGKSTLLRMIAGLEKITSGELYIDGVLANALEPRDRDIAMVFQYYALFPHMSVYDNLAFGLRLRRASLETIDERVREAAEMLDLTPLLHRKGKTLSGGQCQRVALGRAIVRRPKIFLLDEPLSNLDAKLRVQMRTEIAKIHHKLKTTFVYVTHDQTEAMTMGTRVVVMKDGILQQADTPSTLYDDPANLFVACFLGSPQMNIFKVGLFAEKNGAYATVGDARISIPNSLCARIADKKAFGGDALLGIRPEDVRFEPIKGVKKQSALEATVDVIENLGNENIVYLNVDGKDDYAIARTDAQRHFEQGEKVTLYLDTVHLRLFDVDTERSLTATPEYDFFVAKTEVRDGALYLSFAGNDFALPPSVLRRITDRSIVGGEVTVGIRPTAFRAIDDKADVRIVGKVCVCDRNESNGQTTVRVSVAGVENSVVAVLPDGPQYAAGDDIELFVGIDEVALFDADRVRITSDTPISLNSTECVISSSGRKRVYKLFAARNGKCKLAFDSETGGGADMCGQKYIHILPNGFVADNKAVKKARRSALCGTVTHVDLFRGGAVLSVDVKGFDEPITAVLSDYSGGGAGSKIKLAVDPDSIVVGRGETLVDAIKRK